MLVTKQVAKLEANNIHEMFDHPKVITESADHRKYFSFPE